MGVSMVKHHAPGHRSRQPGTGDAAKMIYRNGGDVSNEAGINTEHFRKPFLMLLKEVFAGGTERDFVLDSGMSLGETLGDLSAREASIRVSDRTASIAAQVNHLCVYVEAVIAADPGKKVDWDASWNDVTEVNDDEWAALIVRVDDNFAKMDAFCSTFQDWNESYVGGAMALLAHTAYHLGEIRTGIGVVRERAGTA